jgi:hypothetical protein
MKGWIKTGLLAVLVYVGVFLFNKFFLSQIPDNIVYRVVNAPVYFLLQLFGVVSAGIVFWIGILAYFLLGVVIYFIAAGLDKLTHKTKILEEDLGPEVTKKSMGVEK